MRCSGILMRLLRPILGVAAAILLAPQAAQAAALDPLGACYRSVDSETRESVPVRGTGFTPGETVTVAIDGKIVEQGFADTNGVVAGDVPAPYQKDGERPFTITLTEVRQPANTASAASRVTALALRIRPPHTDKVQQRVRFVGSGFTEGTEVFAHYVRKGKLRRSVSLGAPQGPCGRVNVRRRQFPFKPAVGRWTLQVDNQPIYSAESLTPFVQLTITVRRALRPGG
jgi:hypothetical protein